MRDNFSNKQFKPDIFANMNRILYFSAACYLMFACSQEEVVSPETSTLDNLPDGEIQLEIEGKEGLKTPGDSTYKVLGYGYDITGEYLAESSIKCPVLDIDSFVKVKVDIMWTK